MRGRCQVRLGDAQAFVLEKRAEQINKLTQARHVTLAAVESCTAGSRAHLLSQAEGASETLPGGFAVHTKTNKVAAMGVRKELLAAHTAVSAAVPETMAEGGPAHSLVGIFEAVTGVAGPEPDEDGYPVGRVLRRRPYQETFRIATSSCLQECFWALASAGSSTASCCISSCSGTTR